MKNKFSQRVGIIMAVALIVTMIAPIGAIAEDNIVEVRREDVGQMALDYSPVVKGLELNQISLSQNYLDYFDNPQIEVLQTLYDNLGDYATLYNLKNSLTSPYYDTYMGLMMSLDATNPDPLVLAQAMAMVDGDDPDDNLDANDIDNAAELLLASEVLLMPIESYVAYIGLQYQYAQLGITNPNISKSTKFNMFITPLEIVPASIQTGAMLVGVGVDQSKASIVSGAEAIFDVVLLMEGYEEVQRLSYEMAVDTLAATTRKYELGQASEVDYRTAQNDLQIALLNYQSMQRQVENYEMQLNTMLGQAVTSPLALTEESGKTTQLKSLEFYIERGLEEHADIRNNRLNMNNKSDEMTYIEKYLVPSSIEYKRADNTLEDYGLERAYIEKEITADIMNAYAEVLNKEDYYNVMRLAMEEALRQQKDMALNVELGFVTSSTAKSLDLVVTLAVNDYNLAYRDYLSAISALEIASTIGAVSY